MIVANWKMNPATLREAMGLARLSDRKGVVIAPPFVFLEAVGKVLEKAVLGAQDTGEVSWRELKNFGVKYVIVGHSERRALGETDRTVNKKVKAALAHDLKVILCVGEPKRKLGVKNNELRKTKRYIKGQLEKDLAGIQNSLIIAYEPIWAIGTGKNDTPKNASEMAGFIKQFFNSKFIIQNSKVLYGGSVNGKNAKSFLKARDIDGLLVGGASLKPKEFKKIMEYNSAEE